MPARAGSSPAPRRSPTDRRSPAAAARAARLRARVWARTWRWSGHQGPVLDAREVPTLVDQRGHLAPGWRPFLTPLRARSGRSRRRAARVHRAGRGAPVERSHPHAPRHAPEPPPLAEHRARHRRARAATSDVPAIRVTRSAGRSPIALGVRHFSTRLEARARKANVQFPDATAGFDEAGRLDLDRLCAARSSGSPRSACRAPSWCVIPVTAPTTSSARSDGTTAAKTSSTRSCRRKRARPSSAPASASARSPISARRSPSNRETRR